MSKVLIVDDEPAICWALSQALGDEGHDVVSAASVEEAWACCKDAQPDVVAMDVRLPGMDGISALRSLPSELSDTPIIVMTAFGSLDTAVQAMSSGAFEYLTKPFDLDTAVHVIRRALASKMSPAREDSARERDGGISELLIGRSPAMQVVFRKIALVAEHDVPVLICGESGTGKELAAIALHRYGRRAGGPFVPICVPAMNESLVESDLFGHLSGAFTGATNRRTGLLEQAEGGIGFFDEIGDIGLATQVKLLRALETKNVTPIGGGQPISCNFRLIAATNRNLEQMVETGRFREDLFYRLNVFRIDLPPLRERAEDIPELARHFLRKFSATRNFILTDATVAELVRRPWYGNVRELRNAVEHSAILARSERIEPHCLPAPIEQRGPHAASGPASQIQSAVDHWLRHCAEVGQDSAGLLDAFLADTEPLLIRHALEASGGNRKDAAKRLGIHRQTLRDKLRRYELDDPESDSR